MAEASLGICDLNHNTALLLIYDKSLIYELVVSNAFEQSA